MTMNHLTDHIKPTLNYLQLHFLLSVLKNSLMISMPLGQRGMGTAGGHVIEGMLN